MSANKLMTVKEFNDSLIDALYKEKGFRISEFKATNLKAFVKKIAKENGLNIEKLSDKIGRCNSSLGFSLRNETLTLKDLKKCLDVIDQPLVILYKGEKYEIDFETLKTK